MMIGSAAPDFTLFNHHREPVSLADLAGKKSLVVFIPFPFTGTCEGELCLIRDRLAELNDLDANVVVVTCDTLPSNAKWAEENGFEFPILSDYWPHGEVTRAYGTFNDKLGVANRSTFVLDEQGIVREIVSTDSLGTPREFEAYVEALGAI